MALIELKQVSFTYPDSQVPAIRNLSLNIDKGQFVVLFGSSGSGKSTLLRLLKKEIQPHGILNGEISINGVAVKEMDELTKNIGFVFQDPENQIVADDVLHELVFGLENIGLSTKEMRNRVAEMVHFFGAEGLLHKKSHELSGGKKQQINLASALLMQPDILLLDEPTSQLDPVSSREFLDMLKRLNDELGMTIIIAEHRLDEVFMLADKIVMLGNGELQTSGEPREVLPEIWNSNNRLFVPAIPSLFLKMDGNGSVPLSIKEGRNWLHSVSTFNLPANQPKEAGPSNNEWLKVKNVFFRYDKKDEFILEELDFSLKKGDFYALMGGNGSGKSTLLKVIAGLIKPEKGKIILENKPLKTYKNKELTRKIGYLPQNPKLFFLHDTLGMELQETMKQWGISNSSEVELLLADLGIEHLISNHPYDFSGGELQKAALACLLLRKPDLLVLDEPTKGLDPISKENLANILGKLNAEGKTILLSTHDIEFVAQAASKCGMMFQGKISSEDVPRNFFKGNFFYTTVVQRIFRDFPEVDALTLEEVISCESVKV